MNFLCKLAINLGGAWIILSIGKWWFHTPDISQLLFGCILGAIIIGSAKLYDLILKLSKKMEDLDKGLDGLRIWAVNELEKKE